MGKNELRERIKQFIQTPAMIKLSLAIVVAIIAAVGLLAGVKSFSTKEAAQVVSVEKDAETTQEEKEATEDMQGVAEEKEEVAEETDVDSEKLDYAAVFLVTINPKLRIYVDADGIVLKMEKANADAETLLDNFTWENKSLQDCFADLLVKAHDDGFLHDSAKVSIELEEKKEEVAINTTVLFEKMETAVAIVCHEKDIEVKVAMKEQESEEVMEKEITAETLTTDNTSLPTDTTEVQTPVEPAEEVTVPEVVAPKTEVKNESSSSSSNKDKDDNSSSKKDNETPAVTPTVPSDYKLVWEDNFNGTELNRDDWNVEKHEPGWVNAELQAYVDSEENIYVKDGNLVLQAIETIGKDGKKSYTSGRVNTQNKHDFKYGKFEARIKVPSGMGFLPAFWMMPTDEQYYGQWPKCGEIDIMEVMGQSTDTLHGTIHYGEPHGQKQGTYVLDASKADFAETFHVYTCEWEPGKITWYVDGIKFHEANDWYTKREGFDEVAYPAPFDQPFYMILNVAVGGSWVGYPDETTEFGDNAQMVVDYVKVYQKDSYDENVVKPEKAEVADSAIGENLLTNGEFANAESMKDGKGWEFLSANGGEGNAEVVPVDGNNALQITTENAGTVDYSIQIVQGPIALKQGNKYKVTFDAWADEAREMKALISAPDLNYIRYWGDQTVNLTTEKQTFTYEFAMEEASDANSRFEMTFGAMNSTATVYIDNVEVEKTGTFEIAEEVKTVLPDGNFVYNSGFDTGADRMKYWTVDSNISGVSYLATNADGVREFKAVVPSTVSALTDVVLKQEDTAIIGGKDYLFTFDAYGTEAKTIKAVIAPDTAEEIAFDVDVATDKKEFSFKLSMPEGVNGADVKFLIGAAGTTYIDNVRVQEDANLINGNFTSGYSGWDKFADGAVSSKVSFDIDEMDNGSNTPAAAITINDTGDTDWYIQLKQPVALEKGKSYRVSFDAWSTIERTIKFAIQQNGGAWTEYSGGQYPIVKPDTFEHFTYNFTMKSESDDAALLTFTMGAVGKQITEKHTVFIDNVVLEEVETPKIPEIAVGTELIVNGDFSAAGDGWACNGTADFSNKNAAFTVAETSEGNPWDVQLTSSKMTLEENVAYELKFKIQSSAARDIKYVCADSTTYAELFAAETISLPANETVEVSKTVVMNATAVESGVFQINMGNLGNGIPASVITIDDVSLVKVGIYQPEQAQPVNVTVSDVCLIKTKDADGNAITDGNNMLTGDWGGSATYTTEGEKVTATITDPGKNPWDIQLQKYGINLEANCEYQLSFKGSADTEKMIEVGLQKSSDDYAVYTAMKEQNLVATLSGEEQTYTIIFIMNANGDANATFYINLGNVTKGHELTSGGVLIIPNEGGEVPAEPSTPEVVENNLLEHGDFTLSNSFDGDAVWKLWPGYACGNDGAAAEVNLTSGNAEFMISNLGSEAWNIQLEYKNMVTLEQGCTYRLKYDAKSTEARKIKAQFSNAEQKIYYVDDANLEDEIKTVEYEFTFTNETNSNMQFTIQLGKYDESTPLSTVTIDNISLVKVSDAPKEEQVMTLSLLDEEEVITTEETIVEEEVSEEEITEVTEETTEESTDETSTEEETTEEGGETVQEDVIVVKEEEDTETTEEESVEESLEESESVEEV